MTEYIPLIITAIVSIITSGVITRLLTIKQQRAKIDAEVEKIESEADVVKAKVFIDITEAQENLRNSLLDEINRKDANCDDRIDRLKNEYEEKIKNIVILHDKELSRMRELFEEERSILENKIDDLLARVAELEYKKERLKT